MSKINIGRLEKYSLGNSHRNGVLIWYNFDMLGVLRRILFFFSYKSSSHSWYVSSKLESELVLGADHDRRRRSELGRVGGL